MSILYFSMLGIGVIRGFKFGIESAGVGENNVCEADWSRKLIIVLEIFWD